MAVDIDDKKLDGKGLSDLWGIIKQYVAQHGSGVVPATEDILGGIMVGSTLSITNAGVLNLPTLVTASTFRSVSVDAYGRVVGGTNPTTLAAYGITDAKIENGVITLGGNTITPITSLSGYATQSWVQQQGYTTNIGTVTQVKIGSTAYNPSSGIVSLPAYPTSLPASDVYSWAKESTKPSYSWSEIGSRPTALSQFTNDSGFVTSSGVTSVATGTGLTGGTITSTGTISINSTYQTYISHGESAYNSLGSYLAKSGGVMTGRISRDSGGAWIGARENVIVYTTRTSAEGNDWHPVIGGKTPSGFWSLGSVGGETLSFSYDTDANYNSNNNTSTELRIPITSGGTLATESYVTSRGYITSSGSCNYANSAGSVAWGNVSGRPSALSSFSNDVGYITPSSLRGYDSSLIIGRTSGNSGDPSAKKLRLGLGTAGHTGSEYWAFWIDDTSGSSYLCIGYDMSTPALKIEHTGNVWARSYSNLPFSVQRGTMYHIKTSSNTHIYYLPMSGSDARRCIFSYIMEYYYQYSSGNYSYHAGNGLADTMGVKYVYSMTYDGRTVTNCWVVTTGGHDAGNMYYSYIIIS